MDWSATHELDKAEQLKSHNKTQAWSPLPRPQTALIYNTSGHNNDDDLKMVKAKNSVIPKIMKM